MPVVHRGDSRAAMCHQEADAAAARGVPVDPPVQAGRPKLSPSAKGLLERGLMRLDTSQRLPRLFFTEAGLAELRRMMADRRLADPKKFAHIRQELGLDPIPQVPPGVASEQNSDG